MSLTAILANKPAAPFVLQAGPWDKFEMPSQLVAEASEKITVALGALAQLEAVEASLNQVLQIEDNETAKLTLVAVLASDGYEVLRPSLESDEEDVKGNTKSALDKLVEGAKSIIKMLYDGFMDFIKGIFDRNEKISKKALEFDAKVQAHKGEPVEDKVTLTNDVYSLFDGKTFDPKTLTTKITGTVAEAFKAAKAEVEKEDGKKFEEIETMVSEEINKFSFKDGEVGEVKALTLSELQTASKSLVGDVTAMIGLRKSVFDKALAEIAKKAKEVEKVKEVTDETKKLVEACKRESRVLTSASKSLLSAAAKIHTAKLAALVTFARNIEEAAE